MRPFSRAVPVRYRSATVATSSFHVSTLIQMLRVAGRPGPVSRAATPGPLADKIDQPVADAILLERGTAAPQGRRKLELRLPEMIRQDADNGLWPRVHELLGELCAEWQELDHRILDIGEKLLAEAKGNDAGQILLEVPGIGPQSDRVPVAAIGNG